MTAFAVLCYVCVLITPRDVGRLCAIKNLGNISSLIVVGQERTKTHGGSRSQATRTNEDRCFIVCGGSCDDDA